MDNCFIQELGQLLLGKQKTGGVWGKSQKSLHPSLHYYA